MTEETEAYRPVVELVLARLKSAPEEFERGHPKCSHWNVVTETINQWGTKAEKDALRKARSDHYMDAAHRSAMKLILAEPEPELARGWKGTTMSASAFSNIVTPLLNDAFSAEYDKP
jgi:hypothetical protein